MHVEELDKLYEYGIKLLDSVDRDMREQEKAGYFQRQSERNEVSYGEISGTIF